MELVFDVLLYVVLVLGLVGVTLGLVSASSKEQLVAFGEALEEFTFKSGWRWLQRNDVLDGVTAGDRRIRVIDRGRSIRYMVQLRGWRGAISLRKANLLERVQEAEGTQERAMRLALNDLFGPLSFSEVVIEDGWLRVERGSFLSAYQLQSIQRVFAQLERIAPLYDGIEVRLRGSDTVSIGLTGGGDSARCPYCHAALELDGEDVCACDTCATLHHRGCLEEHGACTVFGCSGSRREPPVVVA